MAAREIESIRLVSNIGIVQVWGSERRTRVVAEHPYVASPTQTGVHVGWTY